MILGYNEQYHSRCFEEINDVIETLSKQTIYFNAHNFKAPKDSVVYNFSSIPQINPDILDDYEVWDASKRNSNRFGFTYVPVGYHPSMERFQRAEIKDIDVAFFGQVNPRRFEVLLALQDEGLRVRCYSYLYGKERDEILARSKLALSMVYDEKCVFPILRVAHCVANQVPVLSERCADDNDWQKSGIEICEYDDLVDRVLDLLDEEDKLEDQTNQAYEWFKKRIMKIPINQ